MRHALALLTALAVTLSATAKPVTFQYQDLENAPRERQLLDVYPLAEPTKAPAPVLIWIHGGAWRFGNKSHAIEKKATALARHGIILVAINYRFHPAVDFRAQAADVATAIRWVQDNISKHGGDPGRLAVMGHSAGAHLAALTTINQSYLKNAGADPKVIKGVILLDGAGYDIPLHLASGVNRETRIYRTVFTGSVETQQAASPVTHIRKGTTYPAFLIVPVDRRASTKLQSRKLAEKLSAAGAKAAVHIAPGKTHMTLNREWGQAGDAPTEACMEFLQSAFR